MSKKTLFALFAAIAVLAIAVSSVGAITDGEPDREGHPFVGLMVASGWQFDEELQEEVYGPMWR